MSEVNRISAVTLIIKNMERSCNFYSNIPGFKLTFGGTSNDSFTTYQIGKYNSIAFLNLELKKLSDNDDIDQVNNSNNFGRIIFYTDDVDRLYTYFKTNKSISNLIRLENEPVDAPWNERYFHIREPDGFQLSFAQPI
ncbi:VOC family protein [Candidatus Nitrosocosmicus hydrocola]|uniref:VOC family protein n=1 Tax=Candidatus Nitrosocosmicus hydrocola TaxID=1826872 RepID=UPI0011E5A6CE|nr:VOC family protein [Candidatus Nitrosocosmicus hydrocola]